MAIQHISGPLEVWVAPVGEAFPDLADAPAGNWVKLGTAGSKDIAEDGVRVRSEQESEAIRGLGGTGPIAILRPAEDVFVEFDLQDATATMIAYALDGDASRVTDTAAGVGTAGNLHQPIMRGLTVNEQALLLKKDPGSSALAAGAMQYEIPRCAQVGNIEEAYVKNALVMVGFSFQVIQDPTSDFGTRRIEDEVAS